MKKRSLKKAALYDPYLDILGGGEEHILSILQVMADNGYEINIFWNKNLLKQIKKRFSLHCFQSIKFLPNIFHHKKSLFSTLKTLSTLKKFDYFFYVTDGSYFFSSAKKNFIFAMVPNKKLYHLNILNRLKIANYKFIVNSKFTQKNLQKWGINSQVIYPYINDQLIETNVNQIKKQPIILSVGRFFGHLHSKKHHLIIKTYKKLKQKYSLFKNFKLILAGGMKEEDKEYFSRLEKLIGSDRSIILKPNVSFNELYQLYKLASFYWHFTGYGIDENKNPEQVEHLGIAPLQAMAAGCLTFCYNAGGPKEIIRNGENGFLFNNENQLINKAITIIQDKGKQNQIRLKAQKHIIENFSYPVISRQIEQIIIKK